MDAYKEMNSQFEQTRFVVRGKPHIMFAEMCGEGHPYARVFCMSEENYQLFGRQLVKYHLMLSNEKNAITIGVEFPFYPYNYAELNEQNKLLCKQVFDSVWEMARQEAKLQMALFKIYFGGGKK